MLKRIAGIGPIRVSDAMQLIVLGMHRSGTSALAGLLEMAGCHFGADGTAMQASADNPRGFQERQDVFELHQWALHVSGCAWDRPLSLDTDGFPAPVRAEFLMRAARIASELDGQQPWFIKDPRMCLLLPLWLRILEAPVCISIVRHPLEVAASLQRRNGLPIEAGLALWECHLVRARQAAAGLPWIGVRHHDLLTRPHDTLGRVVAELLALGVTGLRMPTADEVAGFISPELHREHWQREDLQAWANSPQVDLFRAIDADPSNPLAVPQSLSLSAIRTLASRDTAFRAASLQESAIREQSAAAIEAQSAQAQRQFERSCDTIVGLQQCLAVMDRQAGRLGEQCLHATSKAEATVSARIADLEQSASASEFLARQIQEELQKKLQAAFERLAFLESAVADAEGAQARLVAERSMRQEQMIALEERAGAAESERTLLRAGLDAAAAQTAELERLKTALRDDRERLRAELDATTARLSRSDLTATETEQERARLQAELRAALDHVQTQDGQIASAQQDFQRQRDALADTACRFAARAAALRAGRLRPAHRKTHPLTAPLERALRRLRGRKPAVLPADDRSGELALIRQSSLFDAAWYQQRYPDVAARGVDPVVHYLITGGFEGRAAGPGFDSRAYLADNLDVAESGINPLLHYLTRGQGEGRPITVPPAPSPLRFVA